MLCDILWCSTMFVDVLWCFLLMEHTSGVFLVIFKAGLWFPRQASQPRWLTNYLLSLPCFSGAHNLWRFSVLLISGITREGQLPGWRGILGSYYAVNHLPREQSKVRVSVSSAKSTTRASIISNNIKDFRWWPFAGKWYGYAFFLMAFCPDLFALTCYLLTVGNDPIFLFKTELLSADITLWYHNWNEQSHKAPAKILMISELPKTWPFIPKDCQ